MSGLCYNNTSTEDCHKKIAMISWRIYRYPGGSTGSFPLFMTCFADLKREIFFGS